LICGGSLALLLFSSFENRYLLASRVKEDDLKWWTLDFVRAYKAHAAGVESGFFSLPGMMSFGCGPRVDNPHPAKTDTFSAKRTFWGIT